MAEDEVERLIAAWQEVRPDIDVSPLAILSRVGRLARHLDIARRSAFSSHGLEAWEFDVLSALRRAGHPYQLSPGQLLTQTLVTSGTMTNRIDKLVAKRLVKRKQDPRDKRVVLVSLSTDGVAKVDGALLDLIEHEKEFLEVLSVDERTQLAGSLRTMLIPFEQKPTDKSR